MSNRLNLYIHIPFCTSKCNYCAFFSRAKFEEKVPEYFNALWNEIESYRERIEDYQISTIYIGGGTPSVVDSQYISKTIELCKKNFNLSSDIEISIESNPESLSREKVDKYLSCGINRISIGLQACQNQLLNFLGRKYSIDEFLRVVEMVKQTGFRNINLDLIFGIPSQAIGDWEESLNTVVSCDVQHVACYSLEIEKGTKFGLMQKNGDLQKVDEDMDREMYYLARTKLHASGILQYEISNFAKVGFECKHNLDFWHNRPYIGFGAAAHSYFEKANFQNAYSIDKYIKSGVAGNFIYLNKSVVGKEQEEMDFITLGLRLIQGFSIEEFNEKFNCNFVEKYSAELEDLKLRKLIVIENGFCRLTSDGLDFHGFVVGRLL